MRLFNSSVVDGLVSGVRFNAELARTVPPQEKATGRARFTRDLFLDVEPDGAGWGVVLRGRDKVLADHKPSTATADPTDAKYHYAATYYNDETAAPRPFVIWSTDDASDKVSAETVAVQAVDFFTPDDEGAFAPFSDRLGALGADARDVVIGLVALVGAFGPCGKVGSFHKPAAALKAAKPGGAVKQAREDAAKARATAAAAVALLARITGSASQISADDQAQIAALLASITAGAA